MKTLIKACFVILAVSLAITPLLACGGAGAPAPSLAPAPPALTPSPAPAPAPTPAPAPGNLPPVVTSFTAQPEKVDLEATSRITCIATDPNDDTLSYAWSATGGTITGSGNIVTWKAPNVDGEYVVTVTVSDGKGGNTVKQVKIIAGHPQTTVVLEPVAGESGSAYSTGDLAKAWLIGDNAANNGIRAFFSFDLTGLTLAEIKEAKIIFNTKETIGNPWAFSAFVYVEQVEYGPRFLQGGDFNLPGFELAKSSTSVPSTSDVAPPISRLLQPPIKNRLQVRLRLGQPTNFNSQDDYVSLSGATLKITCVK